MNHLVLLVCIPTSPTLKPSPNGGDRLATFQAEIPSYKRGDPPMPLQVTAWGAVADQVMAAIEAGAYAVIVGRLRIQKGEPPEFQLSKFHGVGALLSLSGVNSVSLVGRAGRDPEVRYFGAGCMVANLTLAVKRASGDDKPDWFDLQVWGKQAQVAADYVRKGTQLGITGSFALERWADRATGEERSKPVIRVDRLDLLSSRRDAEAGGGGGYSAPGYGGSPSDEEVPF